MSRIELVEVGPRDGLQNESTKLSVSERVDFVQKLVASGIKRIEVGAFVSEKWVPQMAQSGEVIAELYKKKKSGVRFSALVPNVQGMEAARQTSIGEVAIFGACSESFSKQNINCSIKESLERFEDVVRIAKREKRKVRGYLSVAFGCPYEGKVSEARVVDLIEAYLELGVYEVSVGDTIGVASPKQVRSLLKKLKQRVPLKRIALHMHDTRGIAVANVLAGYEMGVRVFDSSYGGLGGCPYAKGASGNVATEDLVYVFERMGVRTGINLKQLLSFGEIVEKWIGHKLPSRVAQAGLPMKPM